MTSDVSSRGRSPTPLTPDARLTVVTFNGWVGQTPAQLAGNLARLADDTGRPHVIAVQEATRFDGTIPGYVRHAKDTGPVDDSSSVLLVRDDVRVVGRVDVDVKGPGWTGPKGRRKTPRHHPGVVLEVDGHTWTVLDAHRVWTGNLRRNLPAYAAEDRALVAWFDAHPDPVVAAGDWNSRAGDPRRLSVGDLAERVGASLLVRGVDGALVRGCQGSARRLKDKYGSDAHRPVVIELTRETK